MLAMDKRWWLRGFGLQLTLLILALASGCSRPVGLQGGADGSQPDPQGVPFHPDSDTGAVGSSGPHAEAQRAGSNQSESDPAAARGVPFKPYSQFMAAGTLLTVRLESSVASARLDVDKTFVAAVDDSIVVDGSTIVSRNAMVRGRVESARVSGVRRGVGYVRLTLESIRIDGRDVPLRTSSLFARGTASQASPVQPGGVDTSRLARSQLTQSEIIRLRKGRRLTFRLTEPVDLASRSANDPVSQRPPISSKTQPTSE
jgi:hypothetical protein